MVYFAQRFAAKKVEVPADFPAVYYATLLEAGYHIRIIEGAFFPKRLKKTDSEARMIRQGNVASAAGVRAAEAVLRAAIIIGDRIIYEGKALTSERLRSIIDQAPHHLAHGGWLALEHGYDQGHSAREMLARRGFEQIGTRRDLGGNERVSWGQFTKYQEDLSHG